MYEIKVAVCVKEKSYCDRFAAYISEHEAGRINVRSYMSEDLFCADEPTDVAVIGEGCEKAAEYAVRSEIPLLELCDSEPLPGPDCQGGGREPDVCDKDNEPSGTGHDGVKYRKICRFVPIDVILHEIKVLANSPDALCGNNKMPLRQLEVIGVFSPDRHEMQMPFTVVLAHLLSEGRHVLYINLMEHSGFAELFEAEKTKDMGNIVLNIREEKLNAEKFSASLYEMDGMSYIPPFHNPGNLHEITPSDIYGLLDFIDMQTEYETVLMDFGEGFAEFDRILAACDVIYCPMRHGYYYNCCMDSFKKYLEASMVPGLTDKVRAIEMPYSARNIKGGGDTLRQLLWSEFGDYVRQSGYECG